MFGFNLVSSFLLLAWAGVADAYPSVWPVNYTDVNDPEFALMGYMTLPPSLAAEDDSTDDSVSIGDLPAVVILPRALSVWLFLSPARSSMRVLLRSSPTHARTCAHTDTYRHSRAHTHAQEALGPQKGNALDVR